MALTWNGPATPWNLSLREIDGVERIDRLYSFTLTLVPTTSLPLKVEAVEEALLGKPVTFAIDERKWHGMIDRVRTDATVREVVVRVRPRMSQLEHEADCRVYQDKSVREIVEDVVRGADLPIALGEPRLTRTISYEECIQYRETSSMFVSRLLQEQGVTCLFDHTGEDSEQVVLTDDPGSIDEEVHRVKWKPRDPTPGEPAIHSWKAEAGIVPKSYALTSWHWPTPDSNMYVPDEQLPGSESSDRGTLFDVESYSTEDEGKHYQTVRSQEEAGQRRTVHGTSDVLTLKPALRFTFAPEDKDRAPSGKVFLVTHIEHRAIQGGGDTVTYSNTFSARPAEIQYRPPRTTPKPSIAGVVSATVVTAQGETEAKDGRDIVLDDRGRGQVFLRFCWQRETDPRIPIPARVSQTWAGAGWGSWFAPRVGQEVLVAFDEGDPDRPVVVGCVYHRKEDIPFDIEQHPTQSGLVSQSTPKEQRAVNEISFDDEQGAEKLRFVAQRDLYTEVKHDQRTEVAGDRIEKIEGKHDVTVTGKHQQQAQSIAMVGSDCVLLRGQEVIIEADRISLVTNGSQVVLAADAHVQGANVKLNCAGADPGQAEPVELDAPAVPPRQAPAQGAGGEDAARVGDPCKEKTASAPPAVLPGSNTSVHINDIPAATEGSQVVAGSGTVLVEGQALARKGDPTVTGGEIAGGSATVSSG